MERVLGIGGYFFRARDPEALATWYEANLGIPGLAGGVPWLQEAGPTVFAPFDADTEYFGRRDQQSMLNFRVAEVALIARSSDQPFTIDRTIHLGSGHCA